MSMYAKQTTPSVFSTGDVVEMKIGGPRMTVERVDKFIRCAWFDSDNRLQRDAFDAVALKLAP